MAEVFEQLQAFRWRDVEVPCTRTRLALVQDNAEHKYYRRPGARLEATGREALRFTATIPFFNGIVPGKNERWGVLYPEAFRRFMVAMQDGSDGILIHPEFGGIVCKPDGVTVDWEAQRRDGVEVEASWRETQIPEVDIDPFSEASPIAEVELGALDLDASEEDIKRLAPEAGKLEFGLEEALRRVAGVFDQIALGQKRAVGRLDALVYRVDRIADAARRAGTPLTWQTTYTAERMKSAAIDIKRALAKAGLKNIVFYTVPSDTTLAGLMPSLKGARVGDVIKLNPRLMSNVRIRAGTIVRYYEPVLK